MNQASQLVIVSNRLPVHRVKQGRSNTWQISPGGLVSALTPILRQRPSTWVGWAGIAGAAPKPFIHEGIHNLPVSLSRDEITHFYEGFSNRTLWPLYHDGVRTPEYRRRWWWPYVNVNRRFAKATAQAVAPNGTVWVHDYHLQLVPAMLREMRSDVRIGFFLHIPFPPQELFAQIPWRRRILEGMLGANVVGFQTRLGAQNFARLCKRYTSARGTPDRLEYEGRRVVSAAFPVSIDVKRFQDLAASPAVTEHCERFRAQLGPTQKIVLGVDRLDYTKGIDTRLRAFQELLRSGKSNPKECVFVQVAIPSRERVTEYQELRAVVERYVGEINGEFGELGRNPLYYLHRSLPIEELIALYRMADVMLVTPLRDGMNLVAKEYVATRLDHTGVLVLSEFTGSANELVHALLVNPHDIDGLEATMDLALHMSQAEQKRRMKALRRVIERNNVFQWADSFLRSLEP